MDVPVQSFHSVIAIELAVAGALLWQIRFLDTKERERPEDEPLPDPRLRPSAPYCSGACAVNTRSRVRAYHAKL